MPVQRGNSQSPVALVRSLLPQTEGQGLPGTVEGWEGTIACYFGGGGGGGRTGRLGFLDFGCVGREPGSPGFAMEPDGAGLQPTANAATSTPDSKHPIIERMMSSGWVRGTSRPGKRFKVTAQGR